MIFFQWLGLAFLALLVGLTLRRIGRQRAGWRANAGWLLLWGAAGVAIARPGVTLGVAAFLGIGRGADLVFYCAILGMFAGFFAVHRRLRRIELDLTQLVRHLAIQQGEKESVGAMVQGETGGATATAPAPAGGGGGR